MSFRERWREMTGTDYDNAESARATPLPAAPTNPHNPDNRRRESTPQPFVFHAPQPARRDTQIPLPVQMPERRRRIDQRPNGTQRITETTTMGTMPLLNRWFNNQEAQMHNDFALAQDNIHATFADRQHQRQHEYNMHELNNREQQTNRRIDNEYANAQATAQRRHDLQLHAMDLDAARFQNELQAHEAQRNREHELNIEQMRQAVPMAEMQMRRAEQRHNHRMDVIRYEDTMQSRYHRIFELNNLRQGLGILERRIQLFEGFGFTADDARNITECRYSEKVQIPSHYPKYRHYSYTILVTGASSVNTRNPYNSYVQFNDGTKMMLPCGHDGFNCYPTREGSCIYLINVCLEGVDSIKRRFRKEYLRSVYCCNCECNVQ